VAERGSADYYSGTLSGERLRKCYDVASPRVKRYLAAEIGFAMSRLRSGDSVLELGCGYGRVAFELAKHAARVVGVDTSAGSLTLARELAGPGSPCDFHEMDASALTFGDGEFDAVVCVQNGICAFGVDRLKLVREALRVTRPGGVAMFSTYASGFWDHRLEWFEAQAEAGLIGEIDREATSLGTIVCRDGLRLGMVLPEEFRAMGAEIGLEPEIHVVDGSSVFAVWEAQGPGDA
jgi:2-polyprenyl-6-hydroxyphenyl methylase/3-demethylubiquinone-9 3-methyltransferase